MNNTITIERKTTQVQSVSLNLPYYATDGYDYYAITGEESGICVFILNKTVILKRCVPSDLPAHCEQISEAAFMAAYQKAKVMLTELLTPSSVEAVAA